MAICGGHRGYDGHGSHGDGGDHRSSSLAGLPRPGHSTLKKEWVPTPVRGMLGVLDPLGSAGVGHTTNNQGDLWPLLPLTSALNFWNGIGLEGQRWPVRRITLPIPDPNTGGSQRLTTSVAETMFTLRDDLAVSIPERDDAPGIQRWSTADINPTTGSDKQSPYSK